MTSLISIAIFFLSVSYFFVSVIYFGVGTTTKPLSGLFLFIIKFFYEIVRIGILFWPPKSFSCNLGALYFSLRVCLVYIFDFLTNFWAFVSSSSSGSSRYSGKSFLTWSPMVKFSSHSLTRRFKSDSWAFYYNLCCLLASLVAVSYFRRSFCLALFLTFQSGSPFSLYSRVEIRTFSGDLGLDLLFSAD